MPSKSKLRILVLGYIIRGPLGGLVWHHLQYLLSLKDLGHDVWYFEDSDDYATCYDPDKNLTTKDPSYGLRFADSIFKHFGFGQRWAYYDAHQSCWLGPGRSHVQELSSTIDVVLNFNGINPPRYWWISAPVRILIDTDPVFTQIRNISDPKVKEAARQHTHFFSFGNNISNSDYSGPLDGLPWQPTRQPIYLPAWPFTALPSSPLRCTTVMQWQSYPDHKHKGSFFGTKNTSFIPLITLPRETKVELEIALSGGNEKVRSQIIENGWRLSDPFKVARTPFDYQAYIRDCWAEFGVAKHGYVVSNCGWFSERSAGYLASGRAVITQDTGFSQWLPVGDGILTFNNIDEAIVSLEKFALNPNWHAMKARELAQEFFNGREVLQELLDQVESK